MLFSATWASRTMPAVRALVTGAAGFIGSHLVDALLDRGDEVALVDHLRRSPRPWVSAALQRGAQLHVADVRDLEAVRRAFDASRPEVVMHLAAQVDVRRSVADPAFDVQVNVAGTVSVMEAARDVGTRRVLLASTAATYGEPETVPTTEAVPTAPLSPYGTSKAAAEWYLAQYSRLHGMSTLALRMSNVYGPRQDPHRESGVVAIFTGVAIADRRATIFGDGRQTRDYVFIDDVVAAWLAAADSDVMGALNISSGAEVSVLDLVEELGLEYDVAPGRPGEITRSCLDPSAAHRVLDWRATVPLQEGLRRTVEHVRRQEADLAPRITPRTPQA
jgi:UDP-glucose 4-epimerase